MAIFGDFLRLVFAASREQHISDLHSKFNAACNCYEVYEYFRYWIFEFYFPSEFQP